jgi:hypothetical protein
MGGHGGQVCGWNVTGEVPSRLLPGQNARNVIEIDQFKVMKGEI